MPKKKHLHKVTKQLFFSCSKNIFLAEKKTVPRKTKNSCAKKKPLEQDEKCLVTSSGRIFLASEKKS